MTFFNERLRRGGSGGFFFVFGTGTGCAIWIVDRTFGRRRRSYPPCLRGGQGGILPPIRYRHRLRNLDCGQDIWPSAQPLPVPWPWRRGRPFRAGSCAGPAKIIGAGPSEGGTVPRGACGSPAPVVSPPVNRLMGVLACKAAPDAPWRKRGGAVRMAPVVSRNCPPPRRRSAARARCIPVWPPRPGRGSCPRCWERSHSG